MKKIAALILVLILAVAALTACTTDIMKPAATEAPAATAEPVVPTEEPVEATEMPEAATDAPAEATEMPAATDEATTVA